MEITKQTARMILMLLALAVCCFLLSFYVESGRQDILNGHEDCRGVDSFTIPNKCADSQIIGNLEVMEFKGEVCVTLGVLLILTSIFLPIFTIRRKEQTEEIKMESIKFSEQ